MNFLEVIGVVVLVSFVIGIIIFFWDNYNYLICNKCGTNGNTERIKRKGICKIYGEIE